MQQKSCLEGSSGNEVTIGAAFPSLPGTMGFPKGQGGLSSSIGGVSSSANSVGVGRSSDSSLFTCDGAVESAGLIKSYETNDMSG